MINEFGTAEEKNIVNESQRLVNEDKEEQHIQQQTHGLLPSVRRLIDKAKLNSTSSNPFVVLPDDQDIDPIAIQAAGEVEPIYPTGPYHLAVPEERERAIKNFATLEPDGQAQVILFFKALIDNVESPNRRVQEMVHFKSLPKAARFEILNYFRDKHKVEANVLLFHTLLAYAGELFYLYWDYIARVEITEALLPDSLQGANVPFNIAVTPFITIANITFDPQDFVNTYLIQKMTKNSTFIDDITKHSFLALQFFLFAFGGGYVEVVDIDEDLQDAIGPLKWIPIIGLMYAAIVYYTAYNFADTIEGIHTFVNTPLQLNIAVNPFHKATRKERKIAGWTAMHQSLSFVERIARMSYGGFMAGKQQLGTTAGILMGSAVGFGTGFVAAGTRVPAAYGMYNPPHLIEAQSTTEAKRAKYLAEVEKQKQDLRIAEQKFDNKYQLSPKLNELKLFFTPTLFLLAVPGIFAYTIADSFDINEAGEAISGALMASTVMIGIHALLGLRDTAIRKEVIRLMEAAKAVDTNSFQPNEFAKGLSNLANFADQASRSFTMGYSLMQMLPSVFNTSSMMAQRRLASAISFAAFIALSAFRYQQAKVQNSIVTLMPSVFSTDEDAKRNNRVVSFFRRSSYPTHFSSSSSNAPYGYSSPGSVQLEVHEDDTSLSHHQYDDEAHENQSLMGAKARR